MADQTLRTSHTTPTSTVVGLFRDADDAHRALLQLIDEGFSADQIGAAFHSGSRAASSTGSTAPSARLIDPDTTGVGSGASGVASGDTAVTPAGLSSGSGTATTGAGRPGPIPGSDLPRSHRSSAEPSSTINDTPVSARSGITPPPTAPVAPDSSRYEAASHNTTAQHSAAPAKQGSWLEKLKHIFTSDDGPHTDRIITETERTDTQDFGAGQGQLNVHRPSYEYSGAAFERSFANLGIPEEHARHLARSLGAGGAIVTVRAGGRSEEAERVLAGNGGEIRYQPTQSGQPDWSDQENERDIELFGDVRRQHGRNVDDGPDSRRAS